MKEETYQKALKKHEDKIWGYADRMHDLVFEMLGDGCSANDAIGLLDNMKMFVFTRTINKADIEVATENIEKIIEMMKEEQCR